MTILSASIDLSNDNPCFAAALEYLARGWSAIPLCPPDHAGVGRVHRLKCLSPGKAPLIPWKAFQRRLPTEAELRQWWQQYPNANVGIVLGSVSGVVGIDIDGPEGEELLLEISGGDIPRTLAFTTPRGGRRLLYRLPPGVIGKGRTFKRGKGELRILGEGSLTVMPPSRHACGGDYTWLHN